MRVMSADHGLYDIDFIDTGRYSLFFTHTISQFATSIFSLHLLYRLHYSSN